MGSGQPPGPKGGVVIHKKRLEDWAEALEKIAKELREAAQAADY